MGQWTDTELDALGTTSELKTHHAAATRRSLRR